MTMYKAGTVYHTPEEFAPVMAAATRAGLIIESSANPLYATKNGSKYSGCIPHLVQYPVTLLRDVPYHVEPPTEPITFSEEQKVEARRWMMEHPFVELRDNYGSKVRWNPEKVCFELCWGDATGWGALSAVCDYPYAYTPPKAEPKTVTPEDVMAVGDVWVIHPLTKNIHSYNFHFKVDPKSIFFLESYYIVKAHTDAGHKLYATKADAELALKLGWS